MKRLATVFLALLFATACQANESPKNGSASPGKPSPPVAINVVFAKQVELGVPLKMKVDVTPKIAADSVQVKVEPNEGLHALAALEKRFASVKFREQHETDFEFMPAGEGVQEVRITVTLTRNGKQQAAVKIVRIPVGEAARQKMAAPVQTEEAASDEVKTLPAETALERKK